jgi:hypothetical protein
MTVVKLDPLADPLLYLCHALISVLCYWGIAHVQKAMAPQVTQVDALHSHMKTKYSDFLEKNLTFQERIEAFTSGILTPDPKPIVLWSMEPGIEYRTMELYERVNEFAGGSFPIKAGATWSYCHGNTSKGGCLYTFGLVARDEETISALVGRSITATYAKIPIGEDFGDAIAARALKLSGKLTSRHRSMLRIFGSTHKAKDTRSRRGFAVYKVIKLLIQNPGQEYRVIDIGEQTELPRTLLSHALNSMGSAGIIDYESPYRDRGRKKTRGWAEYRLIDESLIYKDVEELYIELRKERPRIYLKGYLKSVCSCIRNDPNGIYSADSFPKLKIDGAYISNILSFLKKKGFLDSDFQGGVILSKAKANKNTHLIWEDVLEPIEAVADRLDPTDCKGFYEPLEFYNSSPDMRIEHILRMLAQYDRERTQRGLKSSEEINSVLLTLPKKVMKLSKIVEVVNGARRVVLDPHTVCYHLAGLVKAGMFERAKRGFYRRK